MTPTATQPATLIPIVANAIHDDRAEVSSGDESSGVVIRSGFAGGKSHESWSKRCLPHTRDPTAPQPFLHSLAVMRQSQRRSLLAPRVPQPTAATPQPAGEDLGGPRCTALRRGLGRQTGSVGSPSDRTVGRARTRRAVPSRARGSPPSVDDRGRDAGGGGGCDPYRGRENPDPWRSDV